MTIIFQKLKVTLDHWVQKPDIHVPLVSYSIQFGLVQEQAFVYFEFTFAKPTKPLQIPHGLLVEFMEKVSDEQLYSFPNEDLIVYFDSGLRLYLMGPELQETAEKWVKLYLKERNDGEEKYYVPNPTIAQSMFSGTKTAASFLIRNSYYVTKTAGSFMVRTAYKVGKAAVKKTGNTLLDAGVGAKEIYSAYKNAKTDFKKAVDNGEIKNWKKAVGVSHNYYMGVLLEYETISNFDEWKERLHTEKDNNDLNSVLQKIDDPDSGEKPTFPYYHLNVQHRLHNVWWGYLNGHNAKYPVISIPETYPNLVEREKIWGAKADIPQHQLIITFKEFDRYVFVYEQKHNKASLPDQIYYIAKHRYTTMSFDPGEGWVFNGNDNYTLNLWGLGGYKHLHNFKSLHQKYRLLDLDMNIPTFKDDQTIEVFFQFPVMVRERQKEEPPQNLTILDLIPFISIGLYSKQKKADSVSDGEFENIKKNAPREHEECVRYVIKQMIQWYGQGNPGKSFTFNVIPTPNTPIRQLRFTLHGITSFHSSA